MRHFIRHPVDVPIEVSTGGEQEPSAFHTHDISVGGLAFYTDAPVNPGMRIDIRIPYVQPAFEARARVVWCRPSRGRGYELGVSFLDAEDAFLARMVEQICYIEDYRRTVERVEGRQLSSEEAAVEWIDKYAGGFPTLDDARH